MAGMVFWFIWRILVRSLASPNKNALLWRTFGGILAWQCLMAGLAFAGNFAQFDQPWRTLPLVALTMACTLGIATLPQTLVTLSAIPAWQWTAMQSIRFPLELLLYSLFVHGVIGSQMTFAGYNFDILVGLTAPVMAWLLYAHQNNGVGLWVHRLNIVWNALGLILLLTILSIAVLSVPFAFQVFTLEPSNRMVAAFPFVLLPTFFIPFVMFCHIVALRMSVQRLRANSHAFLKP
jgi:hypothetical protein